MKRELTFYAAFFFIAMLFMRLSGLLAKMVLARALTPYEYGIITLVVVSLPAFFQLFANFSLYDILSHSEYGRKYFGFALVFTVVVMVIISALLLLFSGAFFGFLNISAGSDNMLLLVLVLTAFPVSILADFMGLFRGLRKYTTSTNISLMPPIVRVALVAAAVYIFGITDFFYLLLIFALPSFLVMLFYLAKERKTMLAYMKKIKIPSRDEMSFGLSLFLVGTFLSSNYVIIKIVVSHLLGAEWQGYFDISLTLVSVLTFFSLTLHFLAVPEFTSKESRDSILRRPGGLGDITRVLFSYLVLSVIILHFYSVPLVELLFSETYSIAATYTSIIAIGFLFLFIQRFAAYMDISLSRNMKEQKPMVLVSSIFLIALPFFTYLMIIMLGFFGAYVSMAVLSVLYTVATILVSKEPSGFLIIFRRAWGLAVSAAIAFLFLYVTGLPMVYGIVSSLLIYTVLLFTTGYASRKVLKDVFKKKKN